MTTAIIVNNSFLLFAKWQITVPTSSIIAHFIEVKPFINRYFLDVIIRIEAKPLQKVAHLC